MYQSAGEKYRNKGDFRTETEKPAKRNGVEQLQQKVEARLSALETEMARIGKEWVSFGSALQNPKNYTFEVTDAAITLGKSGGGVGRSLGRITPEDTLDWNKFSDLLNDYREATEERAKLTARLSDAGLPAE